MPNRLSRILAVLLLAAGAALAQAAGASAKVVVVEAVKYYPVNGRNGFDLSKAMLAGGARTINLRHAIAATATKFDFINPKLVVKNGRCVVRDVTVKLTITYYFPKWRAKAGTSSRVRRAWKVFYAALVRHEHTHGRIAKKYAPRVERELKQLSGTVMFGCRDFGRMADVRFKSLSAQLKAQQAAFDQREDRKTSQISRLQINLLKAK